jgi:hypothetical protein
MGWEYAQDWRNRECIQNVDREPLRKHYHQGPRMSLENTFKKNFRKYDFIMRDGWNMLIIVFSGGV